MKTRLLSFIFCSLIAVSASAHDGRSLSDLAFHTISYRMNIDLYHCFAAPFPRDFNASLIIKIEADSALQSVRLNATDSSLTIDSVSLAGSSFTHADNLLTINLNHTCQPGDQAEIGIYYHHENVSDNAFFAGNGMAFTNCEPDRARNWFPCHDVPSDKAAFELTAITPSDVKLGSNGVLADSLIHGDTITWHWISTDPLATYLAVISASDNYLLKMNYFPKLSDLSDSIPVRFYYHPDEDPGPVYNSIVPLAAYYQSIFCDYPFRKAGFASMNDLFYGGGMENQTLISLCTTCWREALAAHEFAHMWFGDMITCRTWADLWLNEGFATWATVFWQEHKEGFESYKSFMIKYYAIPYLANNPGWPVADSAWMTRVPSFDTLFNTYITYEKGACLVHQLRYVLGDSVFLRVLKAYCTDTALRYRSASIGDMMKVVNEVSGDNFDWFFNDWLFRPNHPHYRNTYDLVEKEKNGFEVRFRTEQTQPDPPFFRMILPVKIIFADSTDTLVRVMNNVSDQLFTWTFAKQPARLIFDPDTNIMLKEGTTGLGIKEIHAASSPFVLEQNIPNPAVNKTEIRYLLREPEHVKLEIFDMTGKLLQVPIDGLRPAGNFVFQLDCTDYCSGIYFYRMKAGNIVQVKRMEVKK